MTDERTTSYRAVLSNEPFRWLWLAVLLSRAGEAIAQVALPLLVYDLTDSSRLLGAMLVIQLAPRVVLAPIAGLLADRLDRRKLMIRTAILRAATVALIPLATEVWQIGLLAVLVATSVAMSQPAELSALPLTVPKQQLVPALSLTQVTNSIMRIVGPAGGAALVGTAGAGAAFWTESVCFIGAVACLLPLKLPVSDQIPDRGPLLANAWREIGEGLHVVWRTPIVRGITAAECLWALTNASIQIATLVYAEETLDLGNRAEFVYGLLTASISAGALTGALAASRIERRIGRPALMAIGYLGPLFLIPAVFEPPLVLLFLSYYLLGVADALAVIAMQAYLAESVADELRGRVYATWSGLITLAALVTFGLIGWLTDQIGAPTTIALTGIAVGVGAPIMLAVTGALAAVRRPAAMPRETRA